MATPNMARPAPALADSGPRKVCGVGWPDSSIDTHKQPFSQARLRAEQAWAKLWHRSVQVVRLKKWRRPS
jgi:hypothetical protein